MRNEILTRKKSWRFSRIFIVTSIKWRVGRRKGRRVSWCSLIIVWKTGKKEKNRTSYENRKTIWWESKRN
jgi:hypothetical protein